MSNKDTRTDHDIIVQSEINSRMLPSTGSGTSFILVIEQSRSADNNRRK